MRLGEGQEEEDCIAVVIKGDDVGSRVKSTDFLRPRYRVGEEEDAKELDDSLACKMLGRPIVPLLGR